ncbi:MAG: glycoside hydrolase family 3 C-terminal domain-containing protein [Patescibacteria group bacterium]
MSLEYQKHINAMTLEEKTSLLSGANFWNTKSIEHLSIPSIMLTDGPHGLRKQAGAADHLGLGASVAATCFPTAAALANSWDEQLIERVGQAIGAEAAANDVAVLLGPGLNIVRDPLAGRAFEYFSEDPYVAGKLAAAMVRGIQQNGVAATPKHFAVNSQEHMRMSIDEVVDERTMREIYLEGFRRVVKESDPKLIMTSYNKVNGAYANEHAHLLKDILTKEWGYSNALVTDWGGNHDRIAGLLAGSTLEMPSTNGITDNEILQAVKAGTLDEAIVDEQVNRLLQLVFKTSEIVDGAPPANLDAHHELAVDAALSSIVLLKNDANILPIIKAAKIAVIGDFAQTPRYQGAGSSLVNPTQLVSALTAFSHSDAIELTGFEPGFKRGGGKSTQLTKKAVTIAQQAEFAIVFLGLDEAKESEGIDRKTMQLPANQLSLLKEVCAVNDKVIVVLAAGGAIEMPFADDVAAIVHGSLSGQGVGKAVVDIITGRRNPSGKLAVSYPLVYSDTPTAKYFPGKELTAEHREGLYVGYRYYETAGVPVRYPFGHGLSYTTFTYSNLLVNPTGATFTITNTGNMVGAEIAQVYIHPPKTDIFRPVRELKGFIKVSLFPGESRQVTVNFDEHSFAHYNEVTHGWVVEPGEYTIEVSASVQDIRLQTKVSVATPTVASAYDKTVLAAYYSGQVKDVSDTAFEALLGRPLPPALWDRKAKLTYDDTISQLRYKGLSGRFIYGSLRFAQRALFALKKPNLANNVVFILNLPFSKLPRFSGGKISEKRVKRFLRIK